MHFYKDDYQFISIHALREEGDRRCSGKSVLSRDFYPRPPRGGRPVNPCHQITPCEHFYPRPPRGGRRKSLTLLFIMHYFYPRPPRGGRLPQLCLFVNSFLFLSTPSARRATKEAQALQAEHKISIHALREEGDRQRASEILFSRNFYPRPPRGGRREWSWKHMDTTKFLSTPSARRATQGNTELKPSMDISIHALREEGDLVKPL